MFSHSFSISIYLSLCKPRLSVVFLPAKWCNVPGKEIGITWRAFILIPLPVRGPREGASCHSTARVSKLHLPHRGNCQLSAAMMWKMTRRNKHFPAEGNCSKTVFNKACPFQGEKWILAWNHRIFYIGNEL